MNAICLDHPEIFYYNGYSYSRSYYPSSGAVISVTYNIVPKNHGQTNAAIYTTSNIPTYSQKLESAFKSVTVDTSNRYNFVKSVHDYLCDNGYSSRIQNGTFTVNSSMSYEELAEFIIRKSNAN